MKFGVNTFRGLRPGELLLLDAIREHGSRPDRGIEQRSNVPVSIGPETSRLRR